MRAAPALCAIALSLAACSQHGVGGTGAKPSQLDNLVGNAIGDPSTCVLVAERATGRVIYRYGDEFNCDRQLPACDRPGMLNARTALPLAAQRRMASCPTSADGTRSVGWAEGPVPSKKGQDLVYSAVMEGQRALPGHEMNARLYDAFSSAGL
ncbi:MAG TPA: hypothetical protein VME40_02390 [Caulobacteraceae bacterium]|nr:hypothetical protein [Caulobacteraceae bacterium]